MSKVKVIPAHTKYGLMRPKRWRHIAVSALPKRYSITAWKRSEATLKRLSGTRLIGYLLAYMPSKLRDGTTSR